MSTVIQLRPRRPASLHTVNGKVSPPLRRKNTDTRSREYLTEPEVERLIQAARTGRHGQRDATLIMLMYRHGLRVSEAVTLRWDAVELGRTSSITVNRLKGGKVSTHPLGGPEIRALRQLRRDWPDSSYVFVSERGAPMTDSNVRKLVARLGVEAKLGFPAHPHMLRHACGFKLANDGRDTRAIQAYLGHVNIQHTVRYTELAPDRFKGFFKD